MGITYNKMTFIRKTSPVNYTVSQSPQSELEILTITSAHHLYLNRQNQTCARTENVRNHIQIART
jgi:hypothetical protein